MPNRLPDHLPTDVVQRPDFIEACTNRDLGTVFRIARKWAGFTNSHLARRCEMGISQIADYANGRVQPTAATIFERTADGLHIPGHMLGLETRPWEPKPPQAANPHTARVPPGNKPKADELNDTTSPPDQAPITMTSPGQDEGSHTESQTVERRSFLTVSGITAARSVLPASNRVIQALDTVLSEDADTLGTALDSLNELIAHYSEVLPSSPPTSIYDDLLSVRTYAGTLLGRSKLTRHHSDLLTATGWLSNLLAVATSYMNDHGAALVWCADAERRSDEAGHPDLAGWAALNRSMIAYYKGQANRSADLASRGQQSTTAGSVINAKLAAQEMRASAMAGNADAMNQARSRAVKALTRLPSDPVRHGAFSIALAEEPPYTATSLLLVGKFDEAATVTRDVIQTAYPVSLRNRTEKSSNYARTLLILGLAEAGLGHVSDAVAAGRAALDEADVVWPTVVLAGKLDRVLMRDFKNAGEAAEYHELYVGAADTIANVSLASSSQLPQGR